MARTPEGSMFWYTGVRRCGMHGLSPRSAPPSQTLTSRAAKPQCHPPEAGIGGEGRGQSALHTAALHPSEVAMHALAGPEGGTKAALTYIRPD